MSSQVLTGYDVETDAVVESLRELADAIEDQDALLKRVTTAETATVEDPSVQTLMLRYLATEGNEHLRDAIEYAGGGEDE